MTRWSKLSTDEIERRRISSVKAMKEREQADFDRRYQESCDKMYWSFGQCCAGCDHWRSGGAFSGECTAAGIVSGEDVMRSMGIVHCSHPFKPGFPITPHDFHCGKFRDDFDWSTLDANYLHRIGASRLGRLRPKPSPPQA